MLRKIIGLTAALLAMSTVPAVAEQEVGLLPAPTGPHKVGVTTLHLIDHQRTDPWPDAVGKPREVLVSVHYPARSVRGYPVAPQMTSQAAAVFGQLDAVYGHPELPKSGVDWAATKTHSHVGAPALLGRRPVLLYSTGGGDPRTVNTALAEDLASRGFVVVSMDHPGETSEVEFPDGRVRTIALPEDPRVKPGIFRDMIAVRLTDTKFVLDQLEVLAAGGNPDAAGRALPQDLARSLDLRRIGMYGHSAGGTTASQAMYEDPRIDAAVNLEGYLDYSAEPGKPGELLPVARDGVDRPLFLIGTDGYLDDRYRTSWAAMLSHGPRTRHHRITHATHWVFTDFAPMSAAFVDARLMSEQDRVGLVGEIRAERSVPLVRDLVSTFFQRTLHR